MWDTHRWVGLRESSEHGCSFWRQGKQWKFSYNHYLNTSEHIVFWLDQPQFVIEYWASFLVLESNWLVNPVHLGSCLCPAKMSVHLCTRRPYPRMHWNRLETQLASFLFSQARQKNLFTLCDFFCLLLRFPFVSYGLHRSLSYCQSRTVWTLPLSPVQPICCDKKNRSRNQKKTHCVNEPEDLLLFQEGPAREEPHNTSSRPHEDRRSWSVCFLLEGCLVLT